MGLKAHSAPSGDGSVEFPQRERVMSGDVEAGVKPPSKVIAESLWGSQESMSRLTKCRLNHQKNVARDISLWIRPHLAIPNMGARI